LIQGPDVFVTEPLSRTPPVNGVVKTTLELGEKSYLEVAVRWALAQQRLSEGDRGDVRICAEAPGCEGTPGFTVVYLRGGSRIAPWLLVTATLQNAGNVLYRHHASGVDEPGISGVLSLEVSL
jgi:hypothetical protein